jgi:hypothetical protein
MHDAKAAGRPLRGRRQFDHSFEIGALCVVVVVVVVVVVPRTAGQCSSSSRACPASAGSATGGRSPCIGIFNNWKKCAEDKQNARRKNEYATRKVDLVKVS